VVVKLRTIDELDPLEEMALINMSYSRMDTYQMCPSKYFFTYIAKEERVFGPAASLGNVIHNVLEDTVGKELVLDEMVGLIDVHREEYDPDGLITDELIAAGIEMLGEFVDRHAGEKFEIIGKELEFELLIGSAKVIGYIDLVTKRSDGTIVITDYKSGKWEVAQKWIHSNLQVGLYALAAAQMFPDTPIYAELYYLRSGKRKGHLFSPEDIEGVYDTVLEQVNEIIEDKNFRATENRRPCTFCDFAKPENPVCKTGVARMRRSGY